MAKTPPPVEFMTVADLQRGISYYESRTPPLSKGQVARLTELRGELSKRPEEPPPPGQEDLWRRIEDEDRRIVEALPPRHDPADR